MFIPARFAFLLLNHLLVTSVSAGVFHVPGFLTYEWWWLFWQIDLRDLFHTTGLQCNSNSMIFTNIYGDLWFLNNFDFWGKMWFLWVKLGQVKTMELCFKEQHLKDPNITNCSRLNLRRNYLQMVYITVATTLRLSVLSNKSPGATFLYLFL